METDLLGHPLNRRLARRIGRAPGFSAFLAQYRMELYVHTLLHPPGPAPAPAEHERILLIGCGKVKRPVASAAKDLYIGPLFRARRRHAEASGCRWWILSAKHGLLSPESVIEPYDQRLGDRSQSGRWHASRLDGLQAWGAVVGDALEAELAGKVADAEVHAGADYADGLSAISRFIIASMHVPTRGLGVGRQLAFYARLHHEKATPILHRSPQ